MEPLGSALLYLLADTQFQMHAQLLELPRMDGPRRKVSLSLCIRLSCACSAVSWNE